MSADLGLLQMQILWLLSNKPSHGYDLMRQLNEIKKTKITQGTLYPTMQKLVGLEFVKSAEQDNRKVYTITAAGKKAMDSACNEFVDTFKGIIESYECKGCAGHEMKLVNIK